METLPYGTWPSPLDAAAVFAGSTTPSDLVVDGDDLWWVESRPSEGGRQALVRWRDGEGPVDVGPDDRNTRTRVHEYGGAPFAVRDGVVLAASFADQRWWRLDGDEPVAVTPEPDCAAALRFADVTFVPGADVAVAVAERHGVTLDGGADADGTTADGRPHVHNEVVRIDLASGRVEALVTGRDFVAAPRPSPDGRRLAWLAWDHPDMPWDAAELWVATLGADGVAHGRRVAGGAGRSVMSPTWVAADRLRHVEERDGWWRPIDHRVGPDDGDDGGHEVVAWDAGAADGIEVGAPLWRFGASVMATLADGREVWVATDRARHRLLLANRDADGVAVEDLDVPSVRCSHLRPWRDGVAWLGTEEDGSTTVSTWTPSGGVHHVRRTGVEGIREGDLPEVRHVTHPTADGAETHAFVHLPANAEVSGPDDERPPLLVFIHGGPTSNVSGITTRAHAWWTTRGFAVADVNYRGSSGYGQAYRNALHGRWGETDVLDVVAVAEGLARDGVVDGDRMAIRGGSAGGFTTLAALTEPDHPFACGTSFFGVADLRALAEHTHKFEARYLDRLVGPLPEAADVYEARPPLSRTANLSVPILVLQGLEDEVVPPAQSEAIVAAAEENGVPYAYLAFEGEQHGFRQLANLVRWHESELAFYGRVMGFSPAGDLPPLDLGAG